MEWILVFEALNVWGSKRTRLVRDLIRSMPLLLICGFASAQNEATTFVPVAPETFSNSFVRCFYKDSKGYMWLGTADGLFRYDGTNAFRYEHNPEDKTSLCHSSINAILEDSHQKLWVGTARGLSRYNRETDNFISIDSIPGNSNHLNNHYITALAFDRHGRLWIGTHGGGVNVYDPVNLRFTFLPDGANEKILPATNFVNALLCVNDLMWCGTKGGLRLFNVNEQKPARLTFVDETLPVAQITQLVPDKAGNIWLSTINGEIIKLTPHNGYYSVKTVFSGEATYGPGWNNILTLCQDTKGNFWISGVNAGLNYLDIRSGKVTRFPAGETDTKNLSMKSIRAVYVDNTGLTWIGTFSNGAFLIDNNAKKFPHRKQGGLLEKDLSGKHVRSFAEDRDGNIWIAFDGQGLGKLVAKTGVFQNCDEINRQLANKYLTSLVCDRHGNLWIGTGGKGVYCVDLHTRRSKNYTLRSAGFGDDKVNCLYEDKKGTIWAGTFGSGLFYFDQETGSFRLLSEENKTNDVPKNAYVSAIVEDSDGVLWVGAWYGLYALKQTTNNGFEYQMFLPDSKPGSISSAGIQTLCEDEEKNLWIGTTDNGLNVKRRSETQFKVFRKKDGLSTNTIHAIVADAAGNLWVSGNMGLSKFNSKTNTFTNYTRDDGLTSNNFSFNACLRSSAGELFFGSNNGFNAFYPDSIRNDTATPVIHLTDLKISNRSVSIGASDSPLKKHIGLTSAIELSYEQRSFTIDFAAIGFGARRHEYCYKLEGFDNDWNCIGANHTAAYTNIDPGQYVFLVKASNTEGVWSEAPVRLDITVHPVVWKTPWAIALYVVILSSIVLFLIKIRFERMKMKNQLNLEQLAREHEHEVSESKTLFFTNISHEFRTPLSLILMPLESLLTDDKVPSSAKERILTAYKSADKMMRLVNELMEFNKTESGNLKLTPVHGELVNFVKDVASVFDNLADKRNISFSVRTEIPALSGWFDRDKLEKIIVNLLSNAFKFTADGGTITVMMNSREIPVGSSSTLCRCLELVVVDNGMGIFSEEIPHIFDKFYQAKSAARIPNPGTGIGLSLTKALIELHHGFVKVESEPEQETRFTILLPVDAHVYAVENEIQTPADVFYTSDEVKPEGHCHLRVNGEAQNTDKPEILVVEDNDELRTYLAAELRREFKVLEASDGQQGLQIGLDKIPDLIISDILMANKTGIELCKAVREDIKTSHIPLILLTAKAGVEDQIRGIETGADIYLTKPFSIRVLLTHVRNIIGSRQKLYSQFSQDAYLLPAKLTSNEIDQAFLQAAVDYIIKHLQDTQLGIDSLADQFNLSRVQIYRKIKALTGKTAVEFIRMVRLKQALKLMETKKYTLSEIAYRTGFSSAPYFTRSFKDAYGKAPSEYLEATA